MDYELKEFRKELREIGYKVKTKSYSDFIGASVLCQDGESVLGGYFTPSELEDHKRKHAAALSLIDRYRGKTFYGGFRVVIS